VQLPGDLLGDVAEWFRHLIVDQEGESPNAGSNPVVLVPLSGRRLRGGAFFIAQ
jgi:hypothetical protein